MPTIDFRTGSEEFIFEREQDLLDYIRNNLIDPEARTVQYTDNFTAEDGQSEFVLSQNSVRNVADTITQNGTTLRKGYDYYVVYGEGKDPTTVNLRIGATSGDTISIVYNFGSSMVEREYSRDDVKLPRVVMMFLTGAEEFAGLGDYMEYGRGSYFNCTIRFEVRDKYASRARKILSQLFNICRRLRQQDLYRTNISSCYDVMNFDYDMEKSCYIWQFSLGVQFELRSE